MNENDLDDAVSNIMLLITNIQDKQLCEHFIKHRSDNETLEKAVEQLLKMSIDKLKEEIKAT